MSVRNSEYERLPNDMYATPSWVTEALLSVETFPPAIWEPACGDGHMASVLGEHGFVFASDLPDDFLAYDSIPDGPWERYGIITNPPYSNGLAERFVRHALDLTEPVKGKVAMLLPLAWDSAKGRSDIFKEHPAFKAKYILTRRISWENIEQKANGPSMNHCWAIWDWAKGPAAPPTIGWLP